MSKLLRRLLYSNTWQTALMVVFIVFMSIWLTIWLFWRSLYLPELKNHASHLASEIHLIQQSRQTFDGDDFMQYWLSRHAHIKVIDNPQEFPEVTDKIFVNFFTDILAEETSHKLGRSVLIYFTFKPMPKLWIQDSLQSDIWLQEPVFNYSQYSMAVLATFLFGLPLSTLFVIIMLTRTLNRPLKQLQKTANDYILTGEFSYLPVNVRSNEIRAVNIAFNRLFDTLNQSQKERTLMLAGISHDLRTPLTRIRLTAEMLPDDFFKEGLIYDVEDMDAILEQFISFMKDGSDEKARPTDLNAICHEIMVQFANVDFIYQGIDKSVMVRPLSIKRLLINLVNNAIRYGKQPIHLINTLIDKQALPEPILHKIQKNIVFDDAQVDDILLLCVKDEGVGIDENQLERVMQPFERGENARTTGGSGLGLAIVERIASLHYGVVEVINHPEGGLQVCAYIPLINNYQQ